MIPAKRSAIALILFGLTGSFPTDAQQTPRLPRIGYVAQRSTPSGSDLDAAADAFQKGLTDLGYINGKNILIEYRYAAANPERLRTLVKETVQSRVDVLVTPAAPAVRLAKELTTTIPIVMIVTNDPVADKRFVLLLFRFVRFTTYGCNRICTSDGYAVHRLPIE